MIVIVLKLILTPCSNCVNANQLKLFTPNGKHIYCHTTSLNKFHQKSILWFHVSIYNSIKFDKVSAYWELKFCRRFFSRLFLKAIDWFRFDFAIFIDENSSIALIENWAGFCFFFTQWNSIFFKIKKRICCFNVSVSNTTLLFAVVYAVLWGKIMLMKFSVQWY